MTAVGKIFVFINLVFSLVVCGLLVADYRTRTPWRQAYEESAKINEVARKSLQASEEEKQQIRRNAKAEAETLKGLLQKERDDLQEARALLKNRDTEIAALKLKSSQSVAAAGATVAAEERRQVDNEQIRKQLQAERDAQVKLVQANNELTKEALAARIQRDSVMDRNKRLVQQLRDAQDALARVKAGGGTGDVARNQPPPEDVEGLVKTIDSTGMASLTIGSDAGLHKGNTLVAYRFKPTPKYLGTVRVISLTPHQAVVAPVGRLSAPLQPGDVVANKVGP